MAQIQTLAAINMNRLLILIVTLNVTLTAKSQEFDKAIILKNKIKEIHLRIKADSAVIYDSAIDLKYNNQGLLIEKIQNAMPLLYPVNTIEAINYIYQDTLLIQEINRKLLKQNIIEADTVYYYYDTLHRLEFVYSSDNYGHNENLQRFEYNGYTNNVLKKSYYQRHAGAKKLCSFTFRNGMHFYLSFFEMYSSKEARTDYKKLRYEECSLDSTGCQFCLSNSEILINIGDTLKEKILFETPDSYNALEYQKLKCDSSGWFVPKTDIHIITTEKYFNHKIIESHVVNLQPYNTKFNGEGDMYYFYNAQGLLIKAVKKWELQDVPINFKLAGYTETTTYIYGFY